MLDVMTTISAHAKRPDVVHISADGRRFVSHSEDGAVLWDLDLVSASIREEAARRDDGETVHPPHTDVVSEIAWAERNTLDAPDDESADGAPPFESYFAAAASDTTGAVYLGHTGEPFGSCRLGGVGESVIWDIRRRGSFFISSGTAAYRWDTMKAFEDTADDDAATEIAAPKPKLLYIQSKMRIADTIIQVVPPRDAPGDRTVLSRGHTGVVLATFGAAHASHRIFDIHFSPTELGKDCETGMEGRSYQENLEFFPSGDPRRSTILACNRAAKRSMLLDVARLDAAVYAHDVDAGAEEEAGKADAILPVGLSSCVIWDVRLDEPPGAAGVTLPEIGVFGIIEKPDDPAAVSDWIDFRSLATGERIARVHFPGASLASLNPYERLRAHRADARIMDLDDTRARTIVALAADPRNAAAGMLLLFELTWSLAARDGGTAQATALVGEPRQLPVILTDVPPVSCLRFAPRDAEDDTEVQAPRIAVGHDSGAISLLRILVGEGTDCSEWI
jgi:hypothetical protein